jgi:hypothetical protein
MYCTNSLASHAAVMADQSDVIEVTTRGAVRHPFVDLLDRQSSLLVGSPPDLSSEQRAKVVEAANERRNARFDWLGAARIGAREVVWAKHAHYNPRLYTDTAMALLVLGRLSLRGAPTWCQLTPAIAYGLAVGINRAAWASSRPIRPRARARRAFRPGVRGNERAG